MVLEGTVRSIMAHWQRMDSSAACCFVGGEFAPATLSPGLGSWLGRAMPQIHFVWTGNGETSRMWVGCGHRRGVVMPCVAPMEVSGNQMKSEILL